MSNDIPKDYWIRIATFIILVLTFISGLVGHALYINVQVAKISTQVTNLNSAIINLNKNRYTSMDAQRDLSYLERRVDNNTNQIEVLKDNLWKVNEAVITANAKLDDLKNIISHIEKERADK